MRTETTEKQSDAARINGAKSHGPVTPEGKERSAQNSIRHGLASKTVVLANESQEAYDQLLAAYLHEWQPQGHTENELVRDMADARWRLRRIKAMETAALDSEMFIQRPAFEAAFSETTPAMRQADAFLAINRANPSASDNLAKYEARYERAFHRACKSLVQLQQLRAAQTKITNEPEVGQASACARPQPRHKTITRILTLPPQPPPTNTATPETFTWESTFTRRPH